jgi:dipeptidyl aminopeptidase/acylaminoacyl peptidase
MRRVQLLAAAALWTLVSLPVAAGAEPNGGDWTPADSAALRQFDIGAGEIRFSPDGRYFLFVFRYGDVATDSNIYELRVFSVETVRRALRTSSRGHAVEPAATAKIRSLSSHEDQIGWASWDAESRAVLFASSGETGTQQIYRLDAGSGELTQLTDRPNGVKPHFYYRGGGLVFTDKRPRKKAPPLRYPVHVAESRLGTSEEPMVFGVAPGGAAKVLPKAGRMWLAPNGRMAVTALHTLEPLGSDSRVATQVSTGYRYALMDLTSAELKPITPFIEAREKGAPEPTWHGDSERVILAYSPDGKSSHAEYHLATGRWRGVAPPDTKEPAEGARAVNGLTVAVRESAHEAPRIIASDGKREMDLTGPDPVLERKSIARQRTFTWIESDGRVVEGGLTLPRDYRGGRLPLVVQIYVYHPDKFEPDGPHPGTSDAAQSLAAQGFAVAQIPFHGYIEGDSDPFREGPGSVERFDAAVDALVREGIADPERVGLTGFSRGGYATFYIATHPGRTKLAAMVCADSFRGSYASFLNAQAVAGVGERFGTMHADFWKHKAQWLEHETTFNVDRVQAPALFTTNMGFALTDYIAEEESMDSANEVLGAFRANRKPIEFMFLTQGIHNLVRPRERIALQEAVVDWMSFWLQDRENPAPEKAKQNERWRKLRSERGPSRPLDPS